MSGATGRESDKFMLRLPDGMRDRIKTSADANNRSMNAEIVATLEEKYPPPVSIENVLESFEEAASLLQSMPRDKDWYEMSKRFMEAMDAFQQVLDEMPKADYVFSREDESAPE